MLNRLFTRILRLSTKQPLISIPGRCSRVGLGTQMKLGISKFARRSPKGTNSFWLLKMCLDWLGLDLLFRHCTNSEPYTLTRGLLAEELAQTFSFISSGWPC